MNFGNPPPQHTNFYCSASKDIPKEKHWAIISTRTGTEPGYDPGDSPSSFSYVTYQAFLDKEEWVKEVEKITKDNMNSYSKKEFTAMEVNPATISTSVSIKID